VFGLFQKFDFGRSWSALEPLLDRSWMFYNGLGRSWSALGLVVAALEGPMWIILRLFFVMLKRVLCICLLYVASTSLFCKSLKPNQIQRILLLSAVLGPLLGCRWSLLGLSWLLFGRSWLLLSRSGFIALGRFWAALGCSWIALGRSWAGLVRQSDGRVVTCRGQERSN